MMKIMLAAVAAMIFSAGCSTAQIEAMDQAGGIGVLINEKDQFDGMQRIKLSPAWVSKTENASGLNWTAFKVGAQWQVKSPDSVIVMVELPGEIQSITGLGFNIDGDINDYPALGPTQFEVNTGNKWLPTESNAFISMPLENFSQTVTADNVQMRLYMPGGQYLDADFGDLAGTGGAPTARHYLRGKFLPEILEAAKKTSAQ